VRPEDLTSRLRTNDAEASIEAVFRDEADEGRRI
jgi:hypothetical protein